jgi:hypothetical protein
MPTDYLIQYGLSAFVGRFTSTGEEYSRGDDVLICSPRGEERGIVLCETSLPGKSDGALLGVADGQCSVGSLASLVEDANSLLAATAQPATILDAEELRDGTAILHLMRWAECDLTTLVEELAARFTRPIRLHQLQPLPTEDDHAEPSSCGKETCGSGGCSDGGCSTGGCGSSCSRGTSSQDELTTQFLKIREAMEADTKTRRSLTCTE